jgi:ring-1,2-phenylacetyl-CoA epoxidase subunit PaaC
MQAGLDAEWLHLDELFDGSWVAPALVEDGIAVDAATLREPALARILPVVREATLQTPEVTPAVGGGRRGLHTEQMGYLLAEMQHLARSHPGATW